MIATSDVGRSSIAILMTCHNRVDLTMRCLSSVAAQECPEADVSIYLVDDGSSDGTTPRVRAEFPEVRIHAGNGHLFWCGGMRLAQQVAVPSDPDYLLWLNDDVSLRSDALARLLGAHRSLRAWGSPDSIVVGAMKDPITCATAYSGVVRYDRIRKMRFTIVEPTSELVPCETMNGNLVLVPRSVYKQLGLFDPHFTHLMNDFDYGLRARSIGCEVWLAPGHLGTCEFNHAKRAWLDTSRPFRERVNYLLSPRGLPPTEWIHFTRRHGGLLWPGLFIAPYLRFLAKAAVSVRHADGARSQDTVSIRHVEHSLRDPELDETTKGSPSVNPLRVLNVFDVLRPSGAEVMFEVAGSIWAQHGIDPEILTLADAPGPYTDRLATAGYRIHRVAPGPPVGLLRSFDRLLRREQYDVVHIHVERANFWLAAIARFRGIGVVQACHGTFLFDGALRVERTIQRALARGAGVKYVAGSPAVERNERKRFRNPTVGIGNWCDLARFHPPSPLERAAARATLGVVPGQFVIATVGSCAEAKNHSLLVHALASCADLDFVYLHAGDHSAGAGVDEIRLVDELGIGPHVRFLGFVDEVMTVLQAADLFVVPSHSEGSAIAAIEALACGLPALVSDVPGLREVAELSAIITAVDPTPVKLARAILQAISGDGSEQAAVEMPTSPVGLLSPAEGVCRYSALYWTVARRSRGARKSRTR